jgi:hypothetical protein
VNRRDFALRWLPTAGAVLLARIVSANRLLPKGSSSAMRAWIAGHDEIARQLAAGRLSGPAWQAGVEKLARGVALEELCAQLDAERLEKTLDLSQSGGAKATVTLDSPDGRPLRFGAAIFGLRERHAITPHAHKNMVSAHLVIGGALHVRNFQRIADEPAHLIVEPTVDRTLRFGEISTMCTERNNVHWFTAQTPTAFTLDVIVDGLDARDARYVIQLLDVRGAERVGGGRLRARIIEWDESVRLYAVEA